MGLEAPVSWTLFLLFVWEYSDCCRCLYMRKGEGSWRITHRSGFHWQGLIGLKNRVIMLDIELSFWHLEKFWLMLFLLWYNVLDSLLREWDVVQQLANSIALCCRYFDCRQPSTFWMLLLVEFLSSIDTWSLWYNETSQPAGWAFVHRCVLKLIYAESSANESSEYPGSTVSQARLQPCSLFSPWSSSAS